MVPYAGTGAAVADGTGTRRRAARAASGVFMPCSTGKAVAALQARPKSVEKLSDGRRTGEHT
jgi:hypothetical protein